MIIAFMMPCTSNGDPSGHKTNWSGKPIFTTVYKRYQETPKTTNPFNNPISRDNKRNSKKIDNTTRSTLVRNRRLSTSPLERLKLDDVPVLGLAHLNGKSNLGVPDDEGRAPDELNLPSGDPSTRPSKKLFVNDDAAYKETITVVLDTKMSHWNKEAYTKLVSTLEKCSVSICPEDALRLLKTAEQNANLQGNERDGLKELKQLPNKPRRSIVDQAKTTTVPSKTANPDEVVLSYRLGFCGVVDITNEDLRRLDPGAFLNDSLIEFGLGVWLRHVEEMNPELVNQIHVFSPFFYKKFNSKSNLQVAYEGVRKWTNRFDIFQKKYLIMPINERLHWYLAIIYEPEHILKNAPVNIYNGKKKEARSSEKLPGVGVKPNDREVIDNGAKTYIFTFDSLGHPHAQVIKRLTAYLRIEAKNKRGVDAAGMIDGINAPVPIQSNFYDCGVYLLHFARTFISNPRKYADFILSSRAKLAKDTECQAIWLISKDFERQGRQQLRQQLETLSKNWKQLRDGARNLSKGVDDESEGEVEIFEPTSSKDWKRLRDGAKKPSGRMDNELEGEM